MALNLLEKILLEGHDAEMASGGDEVMLPCPLCGDHKKRLYINQHTGLWQCHNCDHAGNLVGFCMDVLGMDPMQAYHEAKKLGGPQTKHNIIRAAETPAEEIKLPEGFLPLVGREFEQPFWDYLTRRGITVQKAQEYRMGYVLTGYYGGRVVIPVYQTSLLKGWVARSIADHSDDPKWRKVLTPPGMKSSHILFNLDNVRGNEEVILVEGVFDALALPSRAVATLGAKLSPTQRQLLRMAGARRLILMWDPDEAGQKGMKKTAGELVVAGFEVLVASLPPGVDPADADSVTVKKALGDAVRVELDSRHGLRRTLLRAS